MSHTSLVQWREWGDAAFAEAKALDRPILLGISAVWCHWCHVMDRGVPGDPVHTGVYSDPQLAGFINARFVPVRVDNDQRPDINARYNMGGWPTTSFLTPGGDVIYGGTYFSPAQMRQLLAQIAQYWETNKDDVRQQIEERRASSGTPIEAPAAQPGIGGLPTAAITRAVVSAIVHQYDRRNGGLGDSQKFPMSDAWDMLLATADAANGHVEMVAHTLIAMGSLGMYDLVAGGWFRYSTTPDWSVPHFEKMLEDHARLLPVYLRAIQSLPPGGQRASLARIVRSSLDYLAGTLLHDAEGLCYFAGSQDADEQYYLMSKSERAAQTAPFIDWRLYTDWNAMLCTALRLAAAVLDEPRWSGLADRVLDTLLRLCAGADGAVTHSITFDPRGIPQASSVHGLLGDQAALARAALDASAGGGQRDPGGLREHAERMLGYAERALSAPSGAFMDRAADPAALGMLSVPITPIFDNAAMADALVLAHHLGLGEGRLARARRALAAFIDEYPRYAAHGGPYALAALRAMHEPEEIMIVAPPDETTAWVSAAQRTYHAWRIVHALDPDRDAALITGRGFPITRLPVAFACRGTTCSAPIFDPAGLGAV